MIDKSNICISNINSYIYKVYTVCVRYKILNKVNVSTSLSLV